MRASPLRAVRLPVIAASLILYAIADLSAQNGRASGSTTPAPAPAPARESADPKSPLMVEGYIKPPESIAHLVTAPREANFTYTAASPGARKYFLRTISDGMVTLNQLGRPHYNLGGFQVDYGANRARTMTTNSRVGFELYEWATGKTTSIGIPVGARVSTATFSPDGATLAFIADFPNSTQIYLADPATGKSRPLTTGGMLATYVQNFAWTADSKAIVTVLVPDARGTEPKEPAIATEPMVRLNEDKKLHTEFYPSLLDSPHDKALLEYYTTGQLAIIDIKTKAVKKIGTPGMIQRLDVAPNAKYFRATYLDKPFSYLIPVSSFGNTEVIIDETGKILSQLSKRPVREQQVDTVRTDTTAAGRGGRGGAAGGAAGRGGAAAAPGLTVADTGRRDLTWQPNGAGMLYLQMTPFAVGQKPDTSIKRKDRVLEWLPPFDSTAASSRLLYETDARISGVQFSDNGRIMFLSQTGPGQPSEVAVDLDSVNTVYPVIASRGGGNAGGGRAGGGGGRGGGRGGAAGGAGTSALVTKLGRRGTPVVIVSSDGKYVYTQSGGAGGGAGRGAGAAPVTAPVPTPPPTPAADSTAPTPTPRAFVERIEIRTGTRVRIYETSSDVPETIATTLDDDFGKILVSRESAKVVPQSFIVDTRTKDAKQITSNTDVMPEMSGLIKKTTYATRADGHRFKINVTLPANWKPGTRLPALFWFYPAEFESQAAYDNPAGRGGGGAAGAAATRFPTYGPRTMSFITFEGYALIEPDTPIFAQNGQLPNDHYVDDLRDDLSATIDALDTLGYIDRTRLAIGGHSYGAFSTVNAMVHTPFFKAGIAGDGDYNRTLTPTGFQNERRDFWQAKSTYLDMSPFLFADHLNGALLMYHSEEDQNVGTAPINSIRMYHALQSLGKTTALFMYPYEDHGPVSKETDLDQWARWVLWLDKYVKNANKPKPALTP
jgi:dipeptidyl aminopeptidase/acylaminoacyl peptidase